MVEAQLQAHKGRRLKWLDEMAGGAPTNEILAEVVHLDERPIVLACSKIVICTRCAFAERLQMQKFKGVDSEQVEDDRIDFMLSSGRH